jgi:acyl-CoA reductase-like NAD-dependent aldehyde dehydrogenase
MASCAKTLKRVTRELGMNDPAFICDDVNVDAVIASVPKRYELLTLQIGISSFLC